MRIPYLSTKREIMSGAAVDLIKDDPVPFGKILEVRHVAFWWVGIVTTDDTEIRLYMGDEYQILEWQANPANSLIRGNIWGYIVPSGYQIAGYSSDLTTNEIPMLTVDGILWDLQTFKHAYDR